jgi:hypothetical protein
VQARRSRALQRAQLRADAEPVMRRIPVLALLLSLCASAAQADEPETIGGRDAAWWSQQARAHERAVAELEQALAACEEREAPPAYRNVPGQLFRGRDGLRYREVANCDEGRAQLEAAEQARDEFEELARRLEVPPGWLRSDG